MLIIIRPDIITVGKVLLNTGCHYCFKLRLFSKPKGHETVPFMTDAK